MMLRIPLRPSSGAGLGNGTQFHNGTRPIAATRSATFQERVGDDKI
jgi:hypothetical protein